MDNLTAINYQNVIILRFCIHCLHNRVINSQLLVSLTVGQLATILETDKLDMSNLVVSTSVLKHANYRGQQVFSKIGLNIEADLSDPNCELCNFEFDKNYFKIFAEMERQAKLEEAKRHKRISARRGYRK